MSKNKLGYLLLKINIIILTFNFTIEAQGIDSSFRVNTINTIPVPFQINGGSVPSQTIVPYHDFQQQTSRITQPLDVSWKKQRQNLSHTLSLQKRNATTITALETEAGGRHTSGHNDAAWQTVAVPINENIMPSYENLAGVEVYEEGVWYRKSFTVNSAWNGNKFITLNFMGVGYIADVWLNGVYLGFHEGGYTPFLFDISTILNYSGTNHLAVRVDVIPWGSAIAENNVTLPFKKVDWFNQWGIYRDVFLMIEDKNHVVRSDIKTINNTGGITSKTIFHNYSTSNKTLNATYEIFKADFTGNENSTVIDGTFINGSALTTSTVSLNINANTVEARSDNFTIPNPEYWYPSKTEAHLYLMKITLREGATILDEYFTQFGLRTLETECSKIILNGEVAPFLVGVGRHEESPTNGRAMTNAEIFNDISVCQNTLKANLIRGHYAFNPITYKFQDRLGIVAFAEIPVYWYHNAIDYTRMSARTVRDQMWREMIYANYNCPSIWFWSTQNESEEWNSLIDHNQYLRNQADNIDGSRIVIQSGVGKNVTDPSHAPLKMVGLTMYYGSFHGNAGDYYGGTKWALEQYHANNPDKPILDTEFGMWSEPNNSNAGHQLYVFQQTIAAFKEYACRTETGQINKDGFVAGCTWWAAFNWYTSHNTLVASMGALSMNRTSTKPITAEMAMEFNKYSSLTPSSNQYDMTYPIPGKIEAENYRYSCPILGYNDLSTGNTGNAFRPDDVDIETTTDAGGGYNIGWTEAGEWLEYSTSVATNGIYGFELRLASGVTNKRIHIEVDGVNVSGSISVPNTGGWQNWQTVTYNNITLTSGLHIIKVVFETDGINFNYINTTLTTPLPVGLIEFKGENKINYNQLSWITTSEVNFSHFELEKSSDGINFNLLGSIPKNKTKDEFNRYEFNDSNNEITSLYYRLKIIDNDGLYKYSQIINITSTHLTEYTIYPNPTYNVGSVTIKLDKFVPYKIKLEVINANGQIVLSNNDIQLNDTLETSIDTNLLPSGMYIIKLNSTDWSKNSVLIIN